MAAQNQTHSKTNSNSEKPQTSSAASLFSQLKKQVKQHPILTRLLIMLLLSPLVILVFHQLALRFPATAAVQSTNGQMQAEFYIATVDELKDKQDVNTRGGSKITTQNAEATIISKGDKEGKQVQFQMISGENVNTKTAEAGQTILLAGAQNSQGQFQYSMADNYRLPQVLLIFLIFFTLTVVIASKRGFTAVLGLIASVLILGILVIPAIVNGANAFGISLLGAVLIAIVSLFLAHGFSKQTFLAVLSTLGTIGLAAIFAQVFTSLAALTGLGSEEAAFVQYSGNLDVNLRGVLLGGMIIGALGILDDVTTSQTATVKEISTANEKLGMLNLIGKGLAVGREHIAALVNSLALAYVGASLPLFLLLTANQSQPIWVVFNSEFIMEEVIRTFVGSTALVLAVPIATVVAAYVYGRRNGSVNIGGKSVVVNLGNNTKQQDADLTANVDVEQKSTATKSTKTHSTKAKPTTTKNNKASTTSSKSSNKKSTSTKKKQ